VAFKKAKGRIQEGEDSGREIRGRRSHANGWDAVAQPVALFSVSCEELTHKT